MPSLIEDVAWRDLAKHPKLIMLYIAFGVLGWLAEHFIPDDKDKQITILQAQNAQLLRRGDSLQASKDELYQDLLHERGITHVQKQTLKTIDSLLVPLGSKAKQKLKKRDHEY